MRSIRFVPPSQRPMSASPESDSESGVRGLDAGKGARMRVAVTGGCGFIGSHVVDHLLLAGHQVAVLDPGSHWSNPAAEYVHADLFDHDALAMAVAGADAVFHLAGAADVN